MYRSDPMERFLLTGRRGIVAGGILAGVFAVLFGLVQADAIAVRDGGPLSRSFASIIGGSLTLLTIVVSINQLILAREFGTPDELYEQIDRIVQYRREAEETAGPALDAGTLAVVIPAAATIGLAPLAIFFAYIVRIATIARRTASLMPFNARESALG